jgi:serine/threonine protein kinase
MLYFLHEIGRRSGLKIRRDESFRSQVKRIATRSAQRCADQNTRHYNGTPKIAGRETTEGRLMALIPENVRIRLPRGEWFFNPARPLGPPGGFGEVFEGRDAEDQPVAVKRLKLTVGEAAHRELKIADDLAGKSFQHVLAVLDSGEDADAGGYYLVMPRAERSLSDELTKRGIVQATESVDILRQIAEGLEEAENIVHRDLKPGNVLFHNGRWKIADFGIARFVEDATSANTVRGFLSAQYAAPEQWLGQHATHATDIYALSCIGYVLITGSPPFPGPSKPDYMRQHTSEMPPPLTDVDPRLRAIIAAGLRKPQAGRPSIERVISVLRDVLEKPVAPTPGIAALHAANAAEAERVSAASAKAERERQKNAERHALIQAGEAVFRELTAELKNVANRNLSEARINSLTGRDVRVSIGQAELLVDLEGAVPPNVFFHNGTWEVLALGSIRVSQKEPPWSHGATLWYMRLGANVGYRWYEMEYRKHALASGPLVGPFPIQEIGNDIYRHADLAAGPGMHVIEVNFGPVAIDDENVEPFLDRWVTRLAQAYSNHLRPF